MIDDSLLTLTESGLYCADGDFYVDPWRPVPRALLTHAHSDHARSGSRNYLCVDETSAIVRYRIGSDISLQTVRYGEEVPIGGVKVAFFPAGHILGSSQVRVERKGRVTVVSGDYKLQSDPTCAAFEPVSCDTFISESTFGLPVYKWPDDKFVFSQINDWWRINQSEGRASVLFVYALGKAQRVLSGVDQSIGPIFTHGAVENLTEIYRAQGVELPVTTLVANGQSRSEWSKALILAPPSAMGSGWLRKLGKVRTGFVSGWMRIRGARRRRSVDRGFVLSDHADWPGLLNAIDATGAERVLLTHGYTSAMVRWLNERGRFAASLSTRFTGEQDDQDESHKHLSDGQDADENGSDVIGESGDLVDSTDEPSDSSEVEP